MTAQLNQTQWEMLSAYLDGRGSRAERERTETWLERDASASEALRALENTRAVLRAVRQRRAPRNFRLTTEMVKTPTWFPAFNILRASSALAAVALAALLVADYFPFVYLKDAQSAAAAVEMTSAAAPKISQPGQPMIITWGGMPAMGGYGKGGGGGGDAAVMGVGGGAAEPGYEVAPTLGAPMAEGPAMQSPLQSTRAADILPTPLEGYEPLLGVRPVEDRGKIISASPDITTLLQPKTSPISNSTFIMLLAGVVFMCAIATWLLYRRLPAWLRIR